MRILICLLAAGVVFVQWQLWGEAGAYARLAQLRSDLAKQNEVNAALQHKNEELAAELYSLEHRQEAIEEQARRGLYMVRPDEILFRLDVHDDKPKDANAIADEQVRAFPTPKLEEGAKPTFEPKKSDLYHAPERLRAPKARDRRE